MPTCPEAASSSLQRICLSAHSSSQVDPKACRLIPQSKCPRRGDDEARSSTHLQDSNTLRKAYSVHTDGCPYASSIDFGHLRPRSQAAQCLLPETRCGRCRKDLPSPKQKSGRE